MRIAILGTRGVPNNYGGFEQFAEYLGIELFKRGHSVTVYNSSLHPFKNKNYKGIEIVVKNCPEDKFGAFANFYYDWLCSYDASKKDFDIIYHAGYQSAAPSIRFFSKKSKAIWLTNMDGIEWKRDKWSKPVKWITKMMEKMAIKYSDYLISDNLGIKEYYKTKHNRDSIFLAYGANIPKNVYDADLVDFNLTKFKYSLVVARLEPENSIDIILDGYSSSINNENLIIVGNHSTKYGEFLKKKYSKFKHIKFVGGIYNKRSLDALRKYAKFYFHGHTVGGTNPSLLEAMAVGANIIAHDNIFNKSVLEGKAQFFKKPDELTCLINEAANMDFSKYRNTLIEIVKDKYNWDRITSEYIDFFEKVLI